MAAGWAANDFMQLMVGIGRPAADSRILRIRPVTTTGPHVTVQELDRNPTCYICGDPPAGVWAIGDGCDLPTRLRSRSIS
jgi:hypothetical protein